MIRRLRLSVLAATLAIVAPLACDVTSGASGSNTNWLSICTDDDDCSGGYSCLCGVCTSACESESTGCPQDVAQCTDLSDVGCAPRDHEHACLPGCSEDADCEGFGDGLACETGVCVAKTALDSPDPKPTDGLKLPDLEPLSGRARLTLGRNSPCVTRAGRVWCWGSNGFGQAGQPAEPYEAPIAELTELERVVNVVGDGGHKCALTEDGRVFCWGLNDRGQVGPTSAPEMTCLSYVLDRPPEDVPCQPTPTQVPGVEGAVALATNDTTSCAVLEDAGVMCWGDTSFLDPAPPELAEGVLSLALGSYGLCAVSSSTGHLWCSNSESPESRSDDLLGVTISRDFDEGPNYGCTLTAAGRVDCWGRDDAGQRGLGSFGSPEPDDDDPPAVARGATKVQVGQNHACALLEDGKVICWGRNDFAQTGTPANLTPRCDGLPCQPSPAPVVGIPPAVDLATVGITTCALSQDAELYCWGDIDAGSPWRIPGPWEGGKNTCDGLDQVIANEILEVRRGEYRYTACQTALDCVELDFGVSCHPGCRSEPMHRNQADEMAAELSRIEDAYCASAEELECTFAAPECPKPAGELACVDGHCVRFDVDATQCDNACACKVLQNLAHDPPVVEQQCKGHHLMLHHFVTCAECERSRLYFAVANYGQTAFTGDATIELSSDTDAELPEAMTVTLSLEPGQHSEPLYFEFSEASGPAFARLIVADNCDYMADWSEAPFELTEPATCSD